MKRSKSIELFLAAGLAATLTACGGDTSTTEDPVTEEAPTVEETAEPAGSSEGGEGGEGGETSYNDTFEDQVSGQELVSALQDGGHVIFFRHAQTEKDYADQVTADVNDCSTQRNLSEAGWEDAKAIGTAFEELSIPVGEVYSSEYCRAWQTADIAFDRYEKVAGLNFAPAEEYTDEQMEQMKAGIMPLLTEVPESGTNTVIVGHDDVFDSATGIYPEPQGVAYVLRPSGQDDFEILANVLPDEWAQLTQQ
ncbi:histidine phosphatase family protein [Sphaerothrix gracilis]|uniref:histidine phosphatase family protein n=1 Tax=Sphaerothrix gracilis TaxID=3151835 RepID=UPI0031FCB331